MIKTTRASKFDKIDRSNADFMSHIIQRSIFGQMLCTWIHYAQQTHWPERKGKLSM